MILHPGITINLDINCCTKVVVKELIGIGGNSHVWRVIDTNKKKTFALKHIRIKEKNIDKVTQIAIKLTEEYKTNFTSEFIVSYYGLSKIDYLEYVILLEYIEGFDLNEWVKKNSLSLNEKISVYYKILSAINVLHKNGIYHKDIKPQNIRITKKNIPKIIDFGTIKNINNNLSIIGNEKISGSLEYMAPEIMLGKEKATKKSDIYSLGCILYEIINKKNYLELCDLDDIPINKMIFHNGELNNENIVSISHCINNNNIIYNVIALATTFNPKNRISNIEEIIQLLDRKYLKCNHDRFFYLSNLPMDIKNISKIEKEYLIVYSDSIFLISGYFVTFYFNNFILYILGVVFLMFGITITSYRFNELFQLYKLNYNNKGIVKFFLEKDKKAILLLGNLLIIIFLLSDLVFFAGIFVIISTFFLKKDPSEKFEIKKSLLKKMVEQTVTVTTNYIQDLYKYLSR